MRRIKQITAVLLCVLTLFSVLSVSTFAAVKPTRPASFTVSAVTANSAKLSWTAGKNAAGYRIYQKVNGKWTEYRVVTGTSYTVTGLYAQNSYEFGIRSLRKEGNMLIQSDGYRTLKFKTKSLVATKLSATASTDSVKLKWNIVPGAAGYAVYQHINGKWKVIGLLGAGKKEGTVKNLTHNTTYRFAIRAVTKVNGKNVQGPASNILTVKTLDGNKIKLACNAVNSSKARLIWSRAADATGYRIYYYSNGVWKTVATINSRDTTSYIVSKMDSDKKYDFRIRAYKKVGAVVKWYEVSNTCSVITDPAAKDLKVYRTAKYNSIFNGDSFTLSYKVKDNKYGDIPVTVAKKGDNYYLSSRVNELEYSLLNNEEGTFVILNERAVYIRVPELLSAPFDISDAASELLPGDNWSSKATVEVFNGKNAVCETFVNPLRTTTLKFYYKAGELLGINEYGLNGALLESATAISVKNSSSASLFSVPFGYGNLLYPQTEEEGLGKADFAEY